MGNYKTSFHCLSLCNSERKEVSQFILDSFTYTMVELTYTMLEVVMINLDIGIL